MYPNRYFRYEGQWRNGRKHGHGKLIMRDGSFYEGDFINGEIEGKGTRFFACDGRKYVGEFQGGECHGEGSLAYGDGSTYEGHFENNKREGSDQVSTSFSCGFLYFLSVF